MIFVENKKRKIERIKALHPEAIILDITSSSPYRYGQILSPFFPHGNIPIPGESHGMTAVCVEGIWQGLKVFEGSDIDINLFRNDTMKNIKRTVRKYGKPLGHRYGVYSKRILNYSDARRYIYIPSYLWVLENVQEVKNVIERIREKAKESDIVFLDYNINPDNRDINKPLSHAELVKMYIEGRYPSKDEDFVPFSPEEIKARKKVAKKSGTKRVKINNAEDAWGVRERIITLLHTTEKSATDIAKIINIDTTSSELKKIIESIPDIKIRKERRTKYYTLGKQETPPELF